MLRAVLVGHPFTDGNKRTAYVITANMLERSQLKPTDMQKEQIVEEIRKIASENIRDIDRIERAIRYVITGH
jgi:prophage maintenance system killer protein